MTPEVIELSNRISRLEKAYSAKVLEVQNLTRKVNGLQYQIDNLKAEDALHFIPKPIPYTELRVSMNEKQAQQTLSSSPGVSSVEEALTKDIAVLTDGGKEELIYCPDTIHETVSDEKTLQSLSKGTKVLISSETAEVLQTESSIPAYRGDIDIAKSISVTSGDHSINVPLQHSEALFAALSSEKQSNKGQS